MTVTVIMTPDWEFKVKIESSRSMHRVVDDVERAARHEVAQHTRSGEMLSTVRSTKTQDGGQVWVGTDHWAYVEYGTKPHVITPTYRNALYWEGARYPVHRVNHPGTHEYAPMRRALAAVKW